MRSCDYIEGFFPKKININFETYLAHKTAFLLKLGVKEGDILCLCNTCPNSRKIVPALGMKHTEISVLTLHDINYVCKCDSFVWSEELSRF